MSAKPLTAAQRELAERIYPRCMAITMGDRRGRQVADNDEFKSAAGAAACAIAGTFDASRGDEKLLGKVTTYRTARVLQDLVHRRHGTWGDTRKITKSGDEAPEVRSMDADDDDNAPVPLAPPPDELPAPVRVELFNVADVAWILSVPKAAVRNLLFQRHREIPGTILRKGAKPPARIEYFVLPRAVPRVAELLGLGDLADLPAAPFPPPRAGPKPKPTTEPAPPAAVAEAMTTTEALQDKAGTDAHPSADYSVPEEGKGDSEHGKRTGTVGEGQAGAGDGVGGAAETAQAS